jgi:para-aminobenzoate synthetase component 1
VPRHAVEPLAIAAGRVFTGLRDVTSDLGALDSAGMWFVAITFEGEVACARFDEVRRATPRTANGWQGPADAGWRSSLDAAAYQAAVRRIRDRIAAGDVYQVNLCRVLSAPLTHARHADVAALAPYASLLRLPSHGIAIASASPELYLRRRGSVVESGPIKGTGRTPDEITGKDHAENVMIVDLVRNDLGRVAVIGTVSVPGLCALESHPGLVHLVSTVRAELAAGAGWADLLGATFPPGSVSGAPKSSALRLIRELEPVPRGPYCGALGWIDADRRRGELAVAIRTFWLADGMVHFGTGAGITWGSDPRDEWAETELKAARLLSFASAGPGAERPDKQRRGGGSTDARLVERPAGRAR